jgi:4-amino-4-deoxy-L-arabinose transferase-like glycosyltransferase
VSGRAEGRREFAFVVAAALLALGLRLAWVLPLSPEIVWFDGEQYARLAQGLVRHGSYLNANGHPSAFWPPGYPLFMAALQAFAGPSVVAVRIAQCVLGALTVVCVHGIAGRLLDPRAARIATLAAAFYPIHVYATGTMFPATLLVALLAGVLWSLLVAAERRSPAAAALAGTLGGWAVLTAGSSLPALLVCAGWLAWRARRDRATVRLLAAFLLPMLLVAGSWTARNLRAFGTPVLVSTNGGYNFWLGNYPGVEAGTGNDFVSAAMEDEARAVWFSAGNEATRDAEFWRLGMGHVRADVPAFLGLTARKALHFWAVTTEPLTRARPRLPIEALASWLSYGLLLPLACAWLLRSLRRDPFAVLALGLAIVYTLVHAVVLSKVRFRLPLDTLVIVYGAGGLVALWDIVRVRRGSAARPGPETPVR